MVVAGGKVKQGVALKLQHTESGELVSSCFRSDGQRTPRCDVHVLMCKNGLGVYMSKLTDLQLKSNGMLYSETHAQKLTLSPEEGNAGPE